MPQPQDLQRYEALLQEAATIHGVSLARDAWKRLRRNRVAMVSLGFLVLLSLLAFFTPLLPLQSPYNVDPTISFAPPAASPLFIETIKTDLPGTVTSNGSDWIDKQFGQLNFFNRWLVQCRAKLFGSWSINSLLGRDELGRDLLAR